MTYYKYTESEVEEAALQWFEEEDYNILFGPDIAPDGETPERSEWDQPFLLQRVRDALFP
jgi:type I restriction enzyme R subunit